MQNGVHESDARHHNVDGRGGGGMEDVLKRLGSVESNVSEVKTHLGALTAQVGGLTEQMGRLTKKVDGVTEQVTGVAAQLSGVMATLSHAATRTDVLHVENTMLRWLVATVIAAMGLVFVLVRIFDQ